MKRWALLLIFTTLGCGGDGDGTARRVDLDVTGCGEGASGLSLLVRVEGTDNGNQECRLDEICIPVSYSGATAEDIEDTLRSRGFPLFDLPADDVKRVTIGVSALDGCPLGIFTTGCGSSPISATGSVIAINMDCGNAAACPTVTGNCALNADAPPRGEASGDIDIVLGSVARD